MPPIDDLFASYLDLAPLHGRRRGLVTCPFHEDRTPSFSVDLDAAIFHCFGCGVEGGRREFAERLVRHGFARALDLAPRQAWAQEPTRTLAAVGEQIRAARAWIAEIRRAAVDDDPATWARLDAAARLETTLASAEEVIDEAQR